MTTSNNASIGTVVCPCKGCDLVCCVFRYRERGAGAVSVANRRFAGKLYARCSVHGRVGGDSGDAAMQEYLLSHAKLDSPAIAGDAPPAKPPATEKKTPAIADAIAPKPRGFGFFRS